jgi:L-alanine-DL-glutamate epimerase-like enolase superfamily enzyme
MKITQIQLFPVRYRMTSFFKFFSDASGNSGRPAIIIKVTADDGSVGWGQSVPIAKWSYETFETALVLLHEYYAPALIGHDPTDIEGAHARMSQAVANGFSTGNPITRSGIDIALHDLAGKIAGKSLAEMWGMPSGEPLELSWTVNVVDLDQVEGLLEEGRDAGCRNFNIKVGPDPEFDRELARRVRAAAPGSFLWADANTGYSVEAALRAAPILADEGVDVLESPLPPNRIDGYRKLKRQGALPILMDEGLVSPIEVEEFADLGMIDGVAMKPARTGGLCSCRRQIEICRERDMMWLGSGLTDPDISFAASVALYSAYGLTKPAALNGTPQFLCESVLKKDLVIEDGRVHPPTGFGLGIEVDEDKVIDLMRRSGGDRLVERMCPGAGGVAAIGA